MFEFNQLNTEKIRGMVDVKRVDDTLSVMQERGISNLLISSPGGDANVMLYGWEHLRTRRVTTIGEYCVGSAALGLFLCGYRRIAFPDTRFLFHEVSNVESGLCIREGEMQMLAEIARLTDQPEAAATLTRRLINLRELNGATAEIISATTVLSRGNIYKLMRGDGIIMTAEEALFYGFVHEIVTPACYAF